MRCSGPVIVSGGEEEEVEREAGRGRPRLPAARLLAGLAFRDREKALVPWGTERLAPPGVGGRERVKARASPSLPPTQKNAGIRPPRLEASYDPTALRIKEKRHGRLREVQSLAGDGSGSG